jgi:hypothetical protein
MAFTTTWARDNADDPRLVGATVSIAQAAVLLDHALATRLIDHAFAADPRAATRWMAHFHCDFSLALGRQCTSLPDEDRRRLAHLFAGGALEPGDPWIKVVLGNLKLLSQGAFVIAALRDFNPEAADLIQYQRELGGLSDQGRRLLQSSLAAGQWRVRGLAVEHEIICHLATVPLPSPLLREVERVLPDLAAAAARQRPRTPVAAQAPARVAKTEGNPNRWVFSLLWLLLILPGVLKSCNSVVVPPAGRPWPPAAPAPAEPLQVPDPIASASTLPHGTRPGPR